MFEIPFDHQHSILFQLHFDSQNLSLEALVFLAEKKDGFIVPYDHGYHAISKCTFRPYHTVQKMIEDAWSYIQREINEKKEVYEKNIVYSEK